MIKKSNNAISEIMGTIMLLMIAVSLFAVIYVFVINEAFTAEENAPSVAIAGTTEGKNLIFENRGGKSLSSDSMICFLSVAGQQMNMEIGPYLEDTNGNGLWDAGERLVFNETSIGIDITGLQVDAAIIDKETDSLVMSGTLQEGEIFEFPYVTTLSETDVESDRAKLWMEYNFRGNYTGDIRFAYKKASGDWNFTSWLTGQSGEGTYGYILIGLIPDTVYQFKAELKYDSTTVGGETKSFKTLGVLVGVWHFDTGSGTTAYDSSGRNNHGTLYYGPNWIPGVNISALSYDGIDDYVRVNDHSSLDITDEITIEAWMKPLEHAEGYRALTTGSVIDASSFGIYNFYEPDLIHISGEIYAIACRGDGNDGYLVTLRIGNDGSISYTILDIFEFYTGDCYEPDILHINGSIYAVAFRSPNQGYIRTVEIYSNGDINRNAKDTFNFDVCYREAHLYPIQGIIYAVVYTGPNYDGYVKTININDDGDIISTLATITYDVAITGYAEEPNMIHISGDIYALVYRNPDSDGEIRTIDIDGSGMITAADHFDGQYLGKFLFDAFDGYEPNITHVSGDIYVIAYGGFDSAGTLRTVEIHADGSIKQDIIDAYEFDTGVNSYGREPSILRLSGDIYVIAYRGRDNDGWLKTVRVYSNGTIQKGIIDSYEFDTADTYDPYLFRIINDIYGVIYSGSYSDGLIKTIKIANNGTISKPVIDYGEIGIFDSQYPDIIHVSGEVYAIAFRGLYNDGFIRTVRIYNNGAINDTIIDTYKFQFGNVLDPKFVHISGEIFAIVYSNYESSIWHGYIRTVRIDNNGNISGTVDWLDFAPTQGIRPSMTHVFGDIYAIAYRGSGNRGYVSTVKITSAGIISTVGMDTKQFYGLECYYVDMIHVIGDVYAIAHSGSGWDGYLSTVKISNTGVITTGIDFLEFDTDYCAFANIINVTDEIFAIVYMAPGSDGFIKTLRIDSNGTIVGGVLDSLEYDTNYGYNPDIIHIKGRAYAIVYTGPSYDGYIKTFRVGENGAITNSVDSNYEFYGADSYEFRIIHIHDDIYAISFRDSNYDGMIRTLEIKYTPQIGYIVARSSAYRLNANSTTVFAIIYGSSGGSQQLTAPLSPGYNYVVLTYDKNAPTNQMKLYINTTLISQASYTQAINTNNNHLYFGWLHSNVDDIILQRKAITQSEINQRFIDLTS